MVTLSFSTVYAYMGYTVSVSHLLTEALELHTQAIFRHTHPALYVFWIHTQVLTLAASSLLIEPSL